MDVSYAVAREALEAADGDVVQALIDLETRQSEQGDLLAVGIELLDDVQKLVEAGGAKKVKVKFGQKIVAEYPVALTAAAAFAVGLAAVIISKATVEIEREEGALEGQF
jgi:hypothetical protein